MFLLALRQKVTRLTHIIRKCVSGVGSCAGGGEGSAINQKNKLVLTYITRDFFNGQGLWFQVCS